MAKVVWTDEAEAQLAEMKSAETAERVVALAAGLGRFPERGRRIPELTGRPEYEILREVILPLEARILYLFIPDSNEVITLFNRMHRIWSPAVSRCGWRVELL